MKMKGIFLIAKKKAFWKTAVMMHQQQVGVHIDTHTHTHCKNLSCLCMVLAIENTECFVKVTNKEKFFR
jgi:hypothetical protein